MTKLLCPFCNETFTIELSLEDANDCTMDCCHCKKLLILKDNELKDFHLWLHNETNGEWPKDGAGTDYVSIPLSEGGDA